MRRILALGLVAASVVLDAAAKERLEDFAWQLPIELGAREGLYQLELTEAVHRGAMRRDLADIRVFNGAGEPVPHAVVPAAISQPPAATLVAVAATPPAPSARRRWEQASGEAETHADGLYRYDLGGFFPVDRVRLELPQDNTVASIRLAVRSGSEEPWRTIRNGIVYRIERRGDEITSPDIVLEPVTERYWLLAVDPRGGGIGSGVPTLHYGWIPARIAFAARGDPPFRLAFGKRDAAAASFALVTLLPGYKAGEPIALPMATLGEPMPGMAPPRAADDHAQRLRKWTLWGALLAAAVVLAAMARRLLHGLATPSGAPRAQSDEAKRPGD